MKHNELYIIHLDCHLPWTMVGMCVVLCCGSLLAVHGLDSQIFLGFQNSDDDQKPVLQPTEKAGDDGTLAVMNNKEILTLQIPLNESGSAGLGVSVKGKTNPEDGMKDLGIFIKAVIHGGAASKVFVFSTFQPIYFKLLFNIVHAFCINIETLPQFTLKNVSLYYITYV